MTAVSVDTLKSISKTKRKDYNAEFKKLKKGDRSEDTIHDARVAARRLNALFEALGIICDYSDNKKLKKKIKNSRKKLGGARDIQIARIFLIKNQDNIKNFDYNSFEDYYQQIQQQALKTTDQFIKKFKRKKLNNKVKQNIKKHFQQTNEEVSLQNLFEKINEEKETLLSEFDLLNRNDKSSFHQLRKDLKKLRYKLEILNEIGLGDYNIDNYKLFQDDLGEIQDIEVIREILNEQYKAAESKNDFKNLSDFLDQEQNKLIDKVLNNHKFFCNMLEKI
jgi:CHAD domain-containing protein